MIHEKDAQSLQDSTLDDDVLWTVVEASHFLKMSSGSLYHLVSQHRIPAIHISCRCLRFSRRALKGWVESLTQEAEQFPDASKSR